MKACPYCAEAIQVAAIVCKHCGRDLQPVQRASAPTPLAAQPAVVSAEGSLICEKCRVGDMQTTKIRRFSPGLVVVGFTLWIPALVVLLGVGGCSVLAPMFNAAGTADTAAFSKEVTIKRLSSIEGVTPEIVAEFKRDDALKDETISKLPERSRDEVRAIVNDHQALRSSSLIVGTGGSVLLAGCGGCVTVVAYAICVPLFVVGLVLTLSKKVWRCGSCGYIFDRA